MTHQHAKDQNQTAAGSTDGVETNGRRDGHERLYYLALQCGGSQSFAMTLNWPSVSRLLHRCKKRFQTFFYLKKQEAQLSPRDRAMRRVS